MVLPAQLGIFEVSQFQTYFKMADKTIAIYCFLAAAARTIFSGPLAAKPMYIVNSTMPQLPPLP